MMAERQMPSAATARRGESRAVLSIGVGGKLLATLAGAEYSMMLRDLASASDIAPAQAHAYLVSFKKMALVEQDSATGRYRLGPLALDLGIARMRTRDPFRMASEAALALARETGLSVAIIVWGTFGPTVIQLEENGSQLNMNTRVGTVYSISGTASGLVFAAFLPAAKVQNLLRVEKLDDHTSHRVGTQAALPASQLDAIRAAGYATIDPTPVPGINAIAAPVFDRLGQIQFVVTLIGRASVLATAPQSQFVLTLLQETRILSEQLGYVEPSPYK